MNNYPKRLIEVDLPIRRISEHARREKSIRHGHISTLHIWWARRPLAACRAVICAALWPDPADPLCPASFREAAREQMLKWAKNNVKLSSRESAERFLSVQNNLRKLDSDQELRAALLDFIADFANWDNSTVAEYLDTSRALTQAAHEGLGGTAGTKPLVVDPFAGGGSIPLEALRVGADAFASDLNPVAVLLNKVVLEFIPKYGQRLADEVRKWGDWVKRESEKELSRFYPKRLIVPEELRNKPLLLVDATPNRFGYVTVLDAQEQLDRDGRAWTHYVPITEGQVHGPTAMNAMFTGTLRQKRDPEVWVKELGAKPLKLVEETPIAYLWARTIQCEGPGCGAEVPLIRSLWLAKRKTGSVALQLVPNPTAKRVDFHIIAKNGDGWVEVGSKARVATPIFEGTIKRGSATCPCCGFTTPVTRVREQLKNRRGGTKDARLLCVVATQVGEQGRFYHLPTTADQNAAVAAREELERRTASHSGELSLVPNEVISLNEIRRISLPLYGMTTWGDMFTPRQHLALSTVARYVREVASRPVDNAHLPPSVTGTLLALAADRLADSLSSSVTWTPGGEFQGHTFTRQALAFVSDFAEVNPWCDSSGNWMGAVEWVSKVCVSVGVLPSIGQVERASAAQQALPNDSSDALITDPPYYDAVPYAHLSDFFFVWLRRSIGDKYPSLFSSSQVPKDEEIVVDRPHELSNSTHDIAFYERELTRAFADGRRVVRPDGISTIVFASKTTASWEAILKAVVDAGWVITGSWPIDTEREARMAAQGQARLASSVHLVCRPRENPDGSVRTDDVGDWRDVLQELPRRIHEWMPRLADEGVVGADAIFACLGPALEVFSRYGKVEKASGETVTLSEYLEYVWAAVAKEALGMVFKGADTSGFEEDARLTAMWLWTLSASQTGKPEEESDQYSDEDEADHTSNAPKGYVLEFDAVRKIAQGLGARLESLTSMVEVTGETARLLSVAERTRKLFGKDDADTPAAARKKRSPQLQLGFVAELEQAEEAGTWGTKGVPSIGATALDRVHQSMILFAAGRGEALRRFLVDEGVGRDERFWRLAQVLSYLYPSSSEEKRWIDGVLARKKGLGF